MRSMTGFGRAAAENGRHRIAVAISTVNHKYLDLALRLPEELRGAEPALRERLVAHVSRGRLDVRIEVTSLVERQVGIRIHCEAVRALAAACRPLATEGLLRAELTIGDLLRAPQLVTFEVAADLWDAEDEALLLATTEAALLELVATRGAEGYRLGEILHRRLDELADVVVALEERRAVVQDELGDTLRRRLQELLGDVRLPEDRLAQEIALLVERGDVREELDRLAAHLRHFREVLANGGVIGKRLDFLSQELLREANTLGAKSRDAELMRRVVEAKLICEQIREQVQNLE